MTFDLKLIELKSYYSKYNYSNIKSIEKKIIIKKEIFEIYKNIFLSDYIKNFVKELEKDEFLDVILNCINLNKSSIMFLINCSNFKIKSFENIPQNEINEEILFTIPYNYIIENNLNNIIKNIKICFTPLNFQNNSFENDKYILILYF